MIVNFSSEWGRTISAKVAPTVPPSGPSRADPGPGPGAPPGLAAIAFGPGIIDTDMLRTCFGTGAARYPGTLPMGQNGHPLPAQSRSQAQRQTDEHQWVILR